MHQKTSIVTSLSSFLKNSVVMKLCTPLPMKMWGHFLTTSDINWKIVFFHLTNIIRNISGIFPELTVKSPIGDRSDCDSALEEILLLFRQNPESRVPAVRPTPDPDSTRIDDVKVIDEISCCFNLKIPVTKWSWVYLYSVVSGSQPGFRGKL